jgi:hypothetical protein
LPGNSVRVHFDVDVGGSYGVKRGIKHTVLVGYLAKKLGMPVRFIEDRLENMRGGDMHGPDRSFDMTVAFDGDGTIRSLRIRALDDVGAYAGRSPLQLGKPVGAIVGPYKINSVEYEPISVLTNKTAQEAVRGFGQAPTNYAIETAIDRVAKYLGMDRLELRKKNFIAKEQFPYLIPSGSTYDSGDYVTVLDKALKAIEYPALVAARDDARKAGRLSGIGIATCLEPSGGNSAFEPLFNPKNQTTTWMDSCLVRVDISGAITGVMNTSTSGQGHETPIRSMRCPPTARSAAAWRSCLAARRPVRRRRSRLRSWRLRPTTCACPKTRLFIAKDPFSPKPMRRKQSAGTSSWRSRIASSTTCHRASSRACRRNSSGRCPRAGASPRPTAASRCIPAIPSKRTSSLSKWIR